MVDTTIGKQLPLGSERLRTCELFAEVLHLQYLYTSSPLFEKLVDAEMGITGKLTEERMEIDTPDTERDDDINDKMDVEIAKAAALAVQGSRAQANTNTPETGTSVSESSSESKTISESKQSSDTATETHESLSLPVVSKTSQINKSIPVKSANQTSVAEELALVTEKFVESKVLPTCLDLFFDFPWNNFLHSVVYDMIAKVFNTYSYTATAIVARPDQNPQIILSPVEERMMAVKRSVRKLVVSVSFFSFFFFCGLFLFSIFLLFDFQNLFFLFKIFLTSSSLCFNVFIVFTFGEK